MAIDIYDTWELAGLIQAQPTRSSFLFDRYVDGDEIEETEGKKVAVDYEFGSDQIAPFVTDSSTGMALSSDGYSTLELDVPNVGVKKSITKDELLKRIAGEDPHKPLDIPQRAQANVLKFNTQLEKAVSGREMLMAANLLQSHGLTIDEKDEKTGATVKSYSIDYLAPLSTAGSGLNARQKAYMNLARNRATFTASTSWATASIEQIIADLEGVVTQFNKGGIPVTELVITPSIWTALQANSTFMDVFANKNLGPVNRYGDLNASKLAVDASVVGHLNVLGQSIALIDYFGTYVDNDGTSKSFLTDGKTLLCTPKILKFKYGSHVIIPEGSNDYENIVGRRIPEMYVDHRNSTKEYRLHCHPLAMPKQFASWSVGTVLG